MASISTATPKGKRGPRLPSCGADAGVGPEDLRKQLAATVDDGRLMGEFRRAVDHAQDLDHAANPVQRAELLAQRSQNAQPDQPGRLVARLDVKSPPSRPMTSSPVGRTGRWPEV